MVLAIVGVGIAALILYDLRSTDTSQPQQAAPGSATVQPQTRSAPSAIGQP